MTSCNEVATAGVKDERSEEAEVPLAGPAAHIFATKEVARTMSAPSTKDVVKLKRILRYVRGHPRGRLLFGWQELPVQLVAQVDSDWAGCTWTRRSTSGGALSFGSCCLAHWSRTQASVAVVSGEADHNGALKGGCELLDAQNVCADLGLRRTGDAWRQCCVPRNAPQRRSGLDEARGGQGKCGFKGISLLVRSDSDKCLARRTQLTLTKHWTSGAAKHFAGIIFEAFGVDSACF